MIRLQKNKMKNMSKVKMQLFGNFALEYNGKVINEETLRSNKLTKLLVYILMNRDNVLTHQRLLEVLENDDSEKPENVLKNLMYRMRKTLRALGEEKFICTSTGAYKWNPEILVETDYEQFEAQVEALQKETQVQKQKEQCREIINNYKNNVSTKVAQEIWMIPKTIWYRSVYMDAVHTLCEILEKEEEWNELELLCNKALDVDDFDEEVHCGLLKSLQGQKKYDQAIVQYEKSKKIFYEKLGVLLPESLQQTFQEMLGDIGEKAEDISKLIEELKETENISGAFVCDYHVFRQMYRMEVRRIERTGMAEHLLLFTLRKKNAGCNEKKLENNVNEGMKELELSVRCCLRAGDAAARYSATQFIVLLPMCSYESSMMVAGRIEKYFKKLTGKKGLKLVWELVELAKKC